MSGGSTGGDRSPDDPRRGVVRQSGLTGIAAIIAVITGLVLDVAVVSRFGATGDTDAFVVAARLPLALLAMVIATANQALVPTFANWLVRYSARRMTRLVSTMLLVVMLMGAALAGVLALFAGPLMQLLAPGFDAPTQALAADLARLMVLMVPLTAGSEVLRAYLNARLSFVMPALMTVVLNTVSIAVILVSKPDVHVIPIAYITGQLAQFAVMMFAARRRGLVFKPTASLRSPEIWSTVRLCGRPLLSSGLNPLARIVEILFASFLPAGSATIMHYGNRLISAVGGTVLFRSVTVAVIPRMSRAAAEGREKDLRALTMLGAKIMIALSFGLTAFTVALAEPGSRLLFQRGRFDEDSATLLGIVMVVYGGSLIGSALQRSLLSPFYANLNTVVPLRNTVYGVGANIVLIPIFVLGTGGGNNAVIGMAAAYSLSQYVHVAHASFCLRKHFRMTLRPVRRNLVRSGLGAVVAVTLMTAIARPLGLYGDVSQLRLLVGLVLATAAGSVVIAAVEVGSFRQLRAVRRGAPASSPSIVAAEPEVPDTADRVPDFWEVAPDAAPDVPAVVEEKPASARERAPYDDPSRKVLTRRELRRRGLLTRPTEEAVPVPAREEELIREPSSFDPDSFDALLPVRSQRRAR